VRPYLEKNSSQKQTGEVAQGVGSEFKFQYHKKCRFLGLIPALPRQTLGVDSINLWLNKLARKDAHSSWRSSGLATLPSALEEAQMGDLTLGALSVGCSISPAT
jgi:hypothetical protein